MVLNNFRYWYQSVFGKWVSGDTYMYYIKPLVNAQGEKKTYTVGNGRAQSLIYEFSPNFSDKVVTIEDKDYQTNLIIGSGTTPVKETDYKLESVISEGLTHISQTASAGSTEDNKLLLTFTRTIRNESGNEITIGEIGLQKSLYEYEGTKGYKYYLLAREVLAEPIKVSSGETFTVSLAIKM